MTSTSSKILVGLLAVLLAGCQIPLNPGQSGVRAFSLKVALSTPSLLSGDRSLSAGRVLLPTAVRVDIAVKNEGQVVDQKSLALSSGSVVAVLQLEVLKTYEVVAQAFDASNKLVFAGSMQLQLTGDITGVLNLFPILTDAQGKEIPWPTVSPTPAQQPAGSSVTQGVSLSAGESTSFLLDFASEATEFTFDPLGKDLELYLQKADGGGVLTLPVNRTLAKADSPAGVWVTYFARNTPGAQTSLGRFTIPTQSITLSGTNVILVNTASTLQLGSPLPVNATNLAGADYDWTSTGPVVVGTTTADGVSFTATGSPGAATITATSKLTSTTATFNLTVTNPPVVTFDTVAPYFTLASPTLTGSADSGVSGSGIAKVWFLRDAVDATGHDTEDPATTGWVEGTIVTPSATSSTWTLTLGSVPDGVWRVWAKAVDNNGKLSPAPTTADFTVDTVNPLVTETLVGTPSSTTNSPWTFGGSAGDLTSGLDTLTVTVDSVTTPITVSSGTWTWPVATLPSDGLHTYTFTATDKAGLVTTVVRAVTVDTTGPTLSIDGPADSTLVADTKVTLSGTAGDTGSGLATIEYKLDTGTWMPVTVDANWTAVLTGLVSGPHTLYVTITDGAGNTSSSSVGFTVANDVTVTFGIVGYQKLSFSVPSLTTSFANLSTITVATNDATLLAEGTNWEWWIDDTQRATTASFTLPNDIPVGVHTVTVFVSHTQGAMTIDYAQSFPLTVTP